MTGAGGEPSPARGVETRTAYIAGTFVATAAAVGAAARSGVGDPGAVTAGALAAWAIQAGAVWTLVGALDRGGPVIHVWVAGIGARVGGLVLVFVAGAVAPIPGRDLLLAYGVEILALLLLEAGWLALRRRPAGRDRDRSNPTEP